jgi:uracil-DNA glycosylase family 4
MKCTQCKWHNNKYDINAATFDGNPDADIVFVGEGYSSKEAIAYLKTGEYESFVGKAGFRFKELLEFAKLERADVAVMNAQRCYRKGNASPTQNEMNACFLHTFRDIQKIKPTLVVAMGAAALFQTTGKTGITNYRGRLLWSDKIRCKVYVTDHPADAVFDPIKWDTIIDDFKNIPYIINADPTSVKLYDYMYIKEESDYLEFAHPVLSASETLYFDLETTGLDPWKNRVTILIIGPDKDNIFIIDAELIPYIRDMIRTLFETKIVVGQGYEFDAKFLAVQYDIFPKNWGHNTMLAEFVLTGTKANSLTVLTGKYDPDAYGYDDEVYAMGGAHKVTDIKTLCQYAANDVGVMMPIKKSQLRKLYKDGLDEVLNKITIPCSRVLTKMSLRGVMYDIELLDQANEKYRLLAEAALNKALALKKVKECEQVLNKRFNPKSSKMIRWLMIDGYKLPVLKKTLTEKPSVTKKEMKIYATKYKNAYARIMEMYRSYEGVQSNFLSGVKEKNLIIDSDGKYGVTHTNYKLHIAATGRPTSSQPNLQNIPKDDDIKCMYVARPGFVYVYADLSQIEVRVAAMLSQDPTLMKACNGDNDFHSTIASEINGYSYEEFHAKILAKDKKFDKLRNAAKETTFGILYGMSKYGLAYRLGISIDEAEDFIRNYFKKMPLVKDLMNGIEAHVIEHGWVATYFGFRRNFSKHTAEDHGTIREAQNHPIQGTAWNIMELILIQLDEKLEGHRSQLIMQTYDSAVIEAREKDVEWIAPIMKETMENVCKPYPTLNTVKVKTEIEVGPNLRDLEEYVC